MVSFQACAKQSDPPAQVYNAPPGVADDGEHEPAPVKPPTAPLPVPIPDPSEPSTASTPSFNASWGVTQQLYKKATAFYSSHYKTIANHNYIGIVDFSLNDRVKRFFIINLKTGDSERHLVAHAAKSDPHNTGFATIFSNTPGTEKSSLGFYLTLDTFFFAKHGTSLHLKGLSPTNSNVESRAIYLHPSFYVSEALDYTGHSWGCLAVDPLHAPGIISKMKNGGMILVDLENN